MKVINPLVDTAIVQHLNKINSWGQVEINNGARPIRQKLQGLSYLSPPQTKANFEFVKKFFTSFNHDRKLIGV